MWRCCAQIDATPRGYQLHPAEKGYTGILACVHRTQEEMRRELYTVVDQGGTVVDVAVENSLYGEIRATLNLCNRYDVDNFIRQAADAPESLLSRMTGGVHLHTLRCPDKDTFARRLMDKPASYFYSVLWNKLYRRDILADHHLQFTSEVRWAEDLVFNLEYILYANVFVSISKAGYHYVQNPQSICHTQINLASIVQNKLQVFRYYGPALIKRAVRERDFSAVDFTLLLCPFTVLGIARVLLGMLFAACGFVTWQSQLNSLTGWTSGIVVSVIGMMGLAALTIVAERDHVGATNKELLAYVLAFPIYMLSYVPISFQAVFAKSEWKPIEHKG